MKISLDLVPSLTLQHAHPGDEEECIPCHAQGLIQNEFERCVGQAESSGKNSRGDFFAFMCLSANGFINILFRRLRVSRLFCPVLLLFFPCRRLFQSGWETSL